MTADYKKYGDANDGPLKPGDVGTVVEADNSNVPYKAR